jgi:hypothetical protein
VSDAVATPLLVEVARENEAIDLARFVQELGLAVTHYGTTVEIREAPADIGDAVTTWLQSGMSLSSPPGAPGGQ